jgi:uncharacterized membrane protein YbhN (UPF0104 family)
VNRFIRGLVAGVAFAVLVYVVAVLVMGWSSVRDALVTLDPTVVLIALGLSTLNYGVRFVKWELSLGWLDVRSFAPRLSLRRSAAIYLAGLSMSVTPGKLGEVLRSWLLHESDGVSFARTAPFVLADRLTDLLALVILAVLAGLGRADAMPALVAATVLIAGCVLILGNRRLFAGAMRLGERLPFIGGVFLKAHGLVDASAILLRLDRLLLLTALSVVGWGLECVGYWFILGGFPGVEASLTAATFLWSFTTVVGALSFLPGGLGASEGSLGLLVTQLATGVTPGIAAASTLLIRTCTLWWGELVGGIALLLVLRRLRGDLPQRGRPPSEEPRG